MLPTCFSYEFYQEKGNKGRDCSPAPGARGSGRTLGVTTLCGGVSVPVREDEILIFVSLSDMGVPLAHVSAVGSKADGQNTSWIKC